MDRGTTCPMDRGTTTTHGGGIGAGHDAVCHDVVSTPSSPAPAASAAAAAVLAVENPRLAATVHLSPVSCVRQYPSSWYPLLHVLQKYLIF